MTGCFRRQKEISSYDLAWETRRNIEATLIWKLLSSGAITMVHSFLWEIFYVNTEVQDWNTNGR